MAEYTNIELQTVAAGQNVRFDERPIYGSPGITHRDGAGIVRLRGAINQRRALYKVSFGGNIQIPTGGTVGEISIALAVDGETLGSATAIATPTAVETFVPVYISAIVEAVCGCCATVAVENISTQAIEVQNANLIVERIA